MTILSVINKNFNRAGLYMRKVELGETLLRRSLGRLIRAKAGTAAIEFAVAVPVLVALLVPVAELGMAFSQDIKTQQAAQAGAQYAADHPWNTQSPALIANAVTAASGLPGIAAFPAPSHMCGCPSGSGVTAEICGSTCANSEIAGYYVVVNAKSVYTSILPYSVLGPSTILSAQSMIRIR